MTMDYEIINVLAEDYFEGNMPEELSAYLIDRYSEEPLEGDWSPQFFFPRIQSDIKSYIRGELDVTLRTDIEKLQDRYIELNNIVCSFVSENQMKSGLNITRYNLTRNVCNGPFRCRKVSGQPLQLSPNWRCNILQKHSATFWKNSLQKILDTWSCFLTSSILYLHP